MRSLLLALTLALLALPAVVAAQTAPLRQHTERYTLDSGLHAGLQGRVAEVFTDVVSVPGAPWLRLTFSDFHLGRGSYLTVTSRQDGAQQRLDAAGIAQWYNASAYFNGDAVEVALHVAPGDQGVFVRMEEVVVGEHGAPESQCGPTDDRQASNDPKAGRLLSIGCTGWLIHDDKIVSAGHCIQSGATTLQFNVPLSTAGGGLQHPPPEHQYSVDQTSRVFVNGGVGNDWGVFRVFDNTQTGLQPSEAQGAVFFVRQDLTPPTIRITGYGVDSGSANQTQQTSTGPNAGSSGTTMRYRTDTEGGNSGSPVIDEATGHSVGVHTHGGCTTAGTGNNSGTSLFSTAFWTAVGVPPPACAVAYQGAVNATVTGGGGAPRLVTFTGTVTNAGTGPRSVSFTLNYNRKIGGNPGPPQGSRRFGPFSYAPGATAFALNVPVPRNAPAGAYNWELVLEDKTSSPPQECGQASGQVTLPPARVAGAGEAVADLVGEDAYMESFPVGSSTASAVTAGVVASPNPFSGRTTLSFSVAEDSDVRLAVYDVLGREVAVLVDGRLGAGTHTAAFEASGLAAGTYVYRLIEGNDVQVGRITIAY
jgi:V8-like Glu-specific endopeptidase